LVIRFTSEPAYSTFTAPEPVAEDDGEAAADDDAAVEAAVDAGVLAAGDEVDELEEELQAAAVRPRHAIASAAAIRRCDDPNVSMALTLATETCITQ
jgi:hypothetical protein